MIVQLTKKKKVSKLIKTVKRRITACLKLGQGHRLRAEGWDSASHVTSSEDAFQAETCQEQTLKWTGAGEFWNLSGGPCVARMSWSGSPGHKPCLRWWLCEGSEMFCVGCRFRARFGLGFSYWKMRHLGRWKWWTSNGICPRLFAGWEMEALVGDHKTISSLYPTTLSCPANQLHKLERKPRTDLGRCWTLF